MIQGYNIYITMADAPEIEWLPLPKEGYEENYEVSTAGEIRNSKTGRILKSGLTKKTGYLSCTPSIGNVDKRVDFHVMVAKAFLVPPDADHNIVNHIDGNKQNNVVSNLEWTTHKGNAQHAQAHNLINHQHVVVEQFNKTGTVHLATFNSVKEAGLATGISAKSISKACNSGSGNAGGYYWVHADPQRLDVEPEGLEVPDHPQYIATREGRIYSRFMKRFLRPPQNGRVRLCDGIPDTPYVHCVIAKTFIPNPNNYEVIKHKDGNNENNRVDNLEWADKCYDVGKEGGKVFIRAVVRFHYNRATKQRIYIDTFDSAIEAERITGTDNSSISKMCQGTVGYTNDKVYGVCCWKYKEDVLNEIPQKIPVPVIMMKLPTPVFKPKLKVDV
jgi:hypothetical protein